MDDNGSQYEPIHVDLNKGKEIFWHYDGNFKEKDNGRINDKST